MAAFSFRDVLVAPLAAAGFALVVFVLWGGGNPVRLAVLSEKPLPREKSFGIDNDFSGSLSEEQKRNVPAALQNAFYIESVQPIWPDELARQMKMKSLLAEETHGGRKYVALQDFRCVGFDNGATGQMIVVERYRMPAGK